MTQSRGSQTQGHEPGTHSEESMAAEATIRSMTAEDTPAVVEMAAALSTHEGAPPPPMTAADLRHWAFGARPRLVGLIAEWRSSLAGYALYHDGFHIGHGRPGTFLMDLFVRPEARRQGIASDLLKAVARATVENEGSWLVWQAHPANVEALAFYKAVGGRRYAAADFELAGAALSALVPTANESCAPSG